jgi:hypothetical protein
VKRFSKDWKSTIYSKNMEVLIFQLKIGEEYYVLRTAENSTSFRRRTTTKKSIKMKEI